MSEIVVKTIFVAAIVGGFVMLARITDAPPIPRLPVPNSGLTSSDLEYLRCQIVTTEGVRCMVCVFRASMSNSCDWSKEVK